MNGSIRRRSDNSWELTVDLGRDASGKRCRKFVNVKGTKSHAQRRLREILASLDRGLPVDTSKMTIGEFLQRWLEVYAVPNTRARTSERYESDIRNHLVPNLGHLLLNKVLPSDVQGMESRLIAEGLSPRSVEHVHRVLSQSFKHAMRWGLTWRNPCDAVQPPRKVAKEIEVPTVATVLQLLEQAKYTPYYAAFYFLAYTGCRRGEACGLMWRDVDLERGVVSIQRAATKTREHGVIMAPPKTAKGKRAITIDPETVDVLRAHRGDQLVQQVQIGEIYSNNGYVFADPQGRPHDPDGLTQGWKRLVRKAGYETMRLHDLRHFHASLLLQAGTHFKTVQERLGHATISVTLDTYSHVAPALQEKAATDFAAAMKYHVQQDGN